MRDTTARAVEMMNIAARFIRDNAASDLAFYDDAECDGTCMADDLQAAAADLEYDQ